MGDKASVTFKMGADDLTFLRWAMDFLAGGIGEAEEVMRDKWDYQFRRALDDHFPLEDDADDEEAEDEPEA